MERIYEQLKDLHVTAVVVYVNEDNKAYEDADYTVIASTETLKELCLKNILVAKFSNGNVMRATGYNSDGVINFGLVTVTSSEHEEA